MQNPIESKVINAVSTAAGIPAASITADRSLDDLGLNSIMAVQLFSKLQKELGVEADLNGISPNSTIGDVVDYFESKAE